MRLCILMICCTLFCTVIPAVRAQSPTAERLSAPTFTIPAADRVTMRGGVERAEAGASRQAEGFVPVVVGGSVQPEEAPWRYPLIGAVIGAAAGAAYATYLILGTDEYLAPPAHFVTIPLGAALGGLIGVIANVVR